MDPEDRRATLVRAARGVFASKGYFKAGVSDIITAAGVARGTFYNYFDSKRDVFNAVLVEIVDEVEGSVEIIDVAQPIPPQVRSNFERILSAVMVEDVVRILFTEASGIDDDGDAALRGFYRRAVARIAKALSRGQEMGIVRDGDMELTARCLLGVIKEPVFQAQLFGEDLEASAVVDELVTLLTTGVLKTP